MSRIRPPGVATRPTPTTTPAAGVTTDGREFQFSRQDFDRIRKLIYERAGISLSEAKQDMVYSRLARRLRARGLQRFSDYLALLTAGKIVQQGTQEEFLASQNPKVQEFLERDFPDATFAA